MANSEDPDKTARNESVFAFINGITKTDLCSKMLPKVRKKINKKNKIKNKKNK